MQRFGLGFKKTFLLIAVMFFFPLFVSAESTQELQGVVLSSPGETITYDIKINSDGTATAYSTSLTYDSDILEIKSVANKNGWKGNNKIASSGPVSLEFSHDGISGETIVATVTFRIKDVVPKSTGSITLNYTKLTIQSDDTGVEMPTVPSVTKKISIKSTDNYLSDLKINGKTVNNFEKTTYNYTVQVDSDVSSVIINATTNSNNSAFVKNFGPRTEEIDYGDTDVLIKVRSEAGEERIYTITVNRVDNREKNNNLKSLIINGGKVKIDFSKDVIDYNLRAYKLQDLDVEAVAEDMKATVNVDIPEEVIIGKNIVTITVTSESKEDKVYTVTIDNSDEEIDTSLKLIAIEGYPDFKFDKDTFDYEIVYNSKYESGLNISKTLSKEMEGVRVDEALLASTNKNLKPGSTIEIKVYYDDEIFSLYTITLIADSRVNFFTVLGLIILVVLLFVLVKVAIKRNKLIKKLHEQQRNLAVTKEVILNNQLKG